MLHGAGIFTIIYLPTKLGHLKGFKVGIHTPAPCRIWVEYQVIWESWNFQASPMGFGEFNNQWGLQQLIKKQLVELAFKHMGMYNQQNVGDETSTTQYKIRGFVSK